MLNWREIRMQIRWWMRILETNQEDKGQWKWNGNECVKTPDPKYKKCLPSERKTEIKKNKMSVKEGKLTIQELDFFQELKFLTKVCWSNCQLGSIAVGWVHLQNETKDGGNKEQFHANFWRPALILILRARRWARQVVCCEVNYQARNCSPWEMNIFLKIIITKVKCAVLVKTNWI